MGSGRSSPADYWLSRTGNGVIVCRACHSAMCVEANQAALRISRRLGDAAISIDQYLSQWPAAGMMFVGLLLALAGALLLGR